MTRLLNDLRNLRQASTKEKERLILSFYGEQYFDVLEAIRLAADPFSDFGLSRVPEIEDDDGLEGTFSFADFKRLCDELRARTLKGEAARKAMREAAQICHVATWNEVYRPILLHQPIMDAVAYNRLIKRLGELAHQLLIPVFAPQIAQAHDKPITGRRLVDAEISGTRLLAFLDNGVHLRTVDATIKEVPSIEDLLVPLARQTPWAMVLDGVLTEQNIYMVFDLIPLADFCQGSCDVPQEKRRIMLEKLWHNGAFDARRVRLVPQTEIDFADAEPPRGYDEFCQHLRDRGLNSVVVKKPESPYKGKRNSAWIARTF